MSNFENDVLGQVAGLVCSRLGLGPSVVEAGLAYVCSVGGERWFLKMRGGCLMLGTARIGLSQARWSLDGPGSVEEAVGEVVRFVCRRRWGAFTDSVLEGESAVECGLFRVFNAVSWALPARVVECKASPAGYIHQVVFNLVDRDDYWLTGFDGSSVELSQFGWCVRLGLGEVVPYIVGLS